MDNRSGGCKLLHALFLIAMMALAVAAMAWGAKLVARFAWYMRQW